MLATGLDEVTAYKVEAAAIDLIGFENLTNRVLGHHARRFGRKSVDTVHAELAAESLTTFPDDCVLIRIRTSCDDASRESAIALYDATRGTWRVALGQASKARYALAVFDGIVREVYAIATWLPAESTQYSNPTRESVPHDRFEFVGRVAPDDLRKQYRWKSVGHLFPQGAANPIQYRGPSFGR